MTQPQEAPRLFIVPREAIIPMPRKKKEVSEKKPKRSNGEGSFSKRRSDGRWQGSIRLEEAEKRIYAYGDTRQEAYDKLQVKIKEVKNGKAEEVKREEMTVGQYLLKYLQIREIDLKVMTLSNSGYTLRKIAKQWENMPLQRLSLDDVQGWLLQLKQRGLKASTIRDYHTRFYTAMKHAVTTKLLAVNPCNGVRLPRVEKRTKKKVLTREQIAFLLDAFKGHWFRAIFVLFLATGLRKGELLALRWEDIDFREKMLHVRENAVWIPNRGYVTGTPKTKASRRTIVLHPFVLDMLHDHLLRQYDQRCIAGDEWQDHGLVFCRALGDHLRKTSMNHALTSKLKKLDMDRISVHGLRHTTATQLLSMKVNPRAVQELLGHEDLVTTLIIYGGILSGDQEKAVMELNTAFWEAEDVKKDVKNGC